MQLYIAAGILMQHIHIIMIVFILHAQTAAAMTPSTWLPLTQVSSVEELLFSYRLPVCNTPFLLSVVIGQFKSAQKQHCSNNVSNETSTTTTTTTTIGVQMTINVPCSQSYPLRFLFM